MIELMFIWFMTATVRVQVTFVNVVQIDMEAGTYYTNTPFCEEGDNGVICI